MYNVLAIKNSQAAFNDANNFSSATKSGSSNSLAKAKEYFNRVNKHASTEKDLKYAQDNSNITKIQIYSTDLSAQPSEHASEYAAFLAMGFTASYDKFLAMRATHFSKQYFFYIFAAALPSYILIDTSL